MKKLILAGATGLALIAAVPAFAAVTPGVPAQSKADQAWMRMDCHGLASEFDKAEPYARMNTKLESAESLRGEGARLCHSGRFIDGIATLRMALHDLGVHPFSKPGPLEDIG